MDLPNPGLEPGSPALQADSLPTELSRKFPGNWSLNLGKLGLLLAFLFLCELLQARYWFRELRALHTDGTFG